MEFSMSGTPLIGLPVDIANAYNANQLGWENAKYQASSLSYQKKLNKLLMEREDNAVQRRMFDLQEAGLHPALAAGSPAQSQPGTAPPAMQRDNGRAERAALAQTLRNTGQSMADLQLANAQVEKAKAEAEKAKAEARNVDADTAADGPGVRAQASLGQFGASRASSALDDERTKTQKIITEQQDYIRKVQSEVHGFAKVAAEKVQAQLDEINYNLETSVQMGVRTTDHNTWLMLANAIGNIIKSIRGDTKEYTPSRTPSYSEYVRDYMARVENLKREDSKEKMRKLMFTKEEYENSILDWAQEWHEDWHGGKK